MKANLMSRWKAGLVAVVALAAGGILINAFAVTVSATISRPPPKSGANLAPPLPDISGKQLLPDALFAACHEPLHGYRCIDYLAAAIALQTLPKAVGEAQLRQWILTDTSPLGLKSRILCLIMFEPQPGVPFNPPWITPDLVPIVDGVPFAKKFGGLGGRGPGPPVDYFDYCYMHGQWTTRRYQLATTEQLQAALARFVAMLQAEIDPVMAAQFPMLEIDQEFYAAEIESPPPAPADRPAAVKPGP